MTDYAAFLCPGWAHPRLTEIPWDRELCRFCERSRAVGLPSAYGERYNPRVGVRDTPLHETARRPLTPVDAAPSRSRGVSA